MKFLQERLLLSDKGYSDLKKAIFACTLTNLSIMLSSAIPILLFGQLLKPFMGQEISWSTMWVLLVIGVLATILVFIAAKNDYKKLTLRHIRKQATRGYGLLNI